MTTIRCRLEPVQSTNLVATGYDPGQRILVVVFRGGATWAYREVEPERYEGLRSAESKGAYLRSEIQTWRAGSPVSPLTIEDP